MEKKCLKPCQPFHTCPNLLTALDYYMTLLAVGLVWDVLKSLFCSMNQSTGGIKFTLHLVKNEQ